MLSSPAMSVLKFTPQERSTARPDPDESAAARSGGYLLGPRRIVALVERFFKARMLMDAVTERVPHMRERVCVEGRDEVFVVIYVDRKANAADLVSTERVGELLDSVPFSAIYPAEPKRAA